MCSPRPVDENHHRCPTDFLAASSLFPPSSAAEMQARSIAERVLMLFFLYGRLNRSMSTDRFQEVQWAWLFGDTPANKVTALAAWARPKANEMDVEDQAIDILIFNSPCLDPPEPPDTEANQGDFIERVAKTNCKVRVFIIKTRLSDTTCFTCFTAYKKECYNTKCTLAAALVKHIIKGIRSRHNHKMRQRELKHIRSFW